MKSGFILHLYIYICNVTILYVYIHIYIHYICIYTHTYIYTYFQSKPSIITAILLYAPITNAEEAEWFYDDIQDLLELTLKKKNVLFITADQNAKIGSQEIPRVTDKFAFTGDSDGKESSYSLGEQGYNPG